MVQRLLGRIVFFISVVCLLGFSITLNAQVNTTSIPGGRYCPGSQYTAPVMVTSLQQVDTISLIVVYPAETLTYRTYRQVNQAINENGFISVIDNGNSLTIRWTSTAAVNITNGILLELVFAVGNTAGSVTFDQVNSYYGDASGIQIQSQYIGAELSLFPRLSVLIEEIDATCQGSCDANVAAFVGGGVPPYQFLWNGLSTPLDSIKTGACAGVNKLNITDFNGCMLDTNFIISVLPVPEVEIEINPDTIYMQNPIVRFFFTDDPDVVDWLWDFGDNTQPSREKNPVHVYYGVQNPELRAYTAQLTVINESGCNGTIAIEIPVSEVEIFIPNVFTPGGNDQINNYFVIAKSTNNGRTPIVSEYERMELVVLDRWGRKVYDNNNYRNDWDGGNLPQGTYYYKLNTFGMFLDESFKGSVTILR